MAWHWDIDDLYARYCRYLLLLNSFSSTSNNISDIYFKKPIPRWCKILFTSHGLTLNQELLIAYLSIGLLVLNTFPFARSNFKFNLHSANIHRSKYAFSNYIYLCIPDHTWYTISYGKTQMISVIFLTSSFYGVRDVQGILKPNKHIRFFISAIN